MEGTMSSSTVLVEFEDSICTLTLNRPEKRNAMNGSLASDFKDAISEIRNEDRARALIVTGSGSAFCAGGDLTYFPTVFQPGSEIAEKGMFDFYSSFLCVTDLPFPTIAAINGPAFGAGACLAVACDMRLAARRAQIAFNFVKLGMSPGMGAEYFLTRLVGPSRTMELLMMGDVIDAEDAFQMGLVNKVSESDALMDHAMAFAGKLADMHPLPVRIIKESSHLAMNSSLTDVLRREAHYQSLCFHRARSK
jgi:enoyl-CoA hydratase/carnithine racemase